MKNVARKWYKVLNFPTEFDNQFEQLLNKTDFSYITTIEEFNEKEHQAEEILIYYLYFCEELSLKYLKKGIPNEILIDTLSDLTIWCKIYHSITGRIGIGVADWIKNHLSFRLFKLGRLQFCMGKFKKDYNAYDVKKGDPVLEIHIAETGKLIKEECENSIKTAKDFFKKYFPNFDCKYFSCNSWLLDHTLNKMLNENSNISSFANLFLKIDSEPSDNILKYVFNWTACRNNINEFPVKSSFAQKIKEHINNGEKFYEVLGIIKF